MGALGVPLWGGVLSTWEMPVDEIVSSGPDRIIVYEGAEDKLKQLNSGVLEKLGVGGPSWEEQERERYRVNLVPVENQLSSGQPVEEQRRLSAAETARFEPEEEIEYVELEERRRDVMPQRRYLDEQPDDPYQNDRYAPEPRRQDTYREDPPLEQPLRGEPQRQDPLPRRSMPVSRRPVQSQAEPMDVEPMDVEPMDMEQPDRDARPRRSREPIDEGGLDDPW